MCTTRCAPPESKWGLTYRVVVTAVHTEKDVLKAVAALAAAVREVCKVSRVATRSSYMTTTGA